MHFYILAILVVLTLSNADVTFHFGNLCNQTIWPSITGNSSSLQDPLPAGLALPPNSTFTALPITAPWSGRVWPRRYCLPDGTSCELGDCGAASCWGKSADHTTLFEITIGNKSENEQGQEIQTAWYDISLVDAYTLGITATLQDPDCKAVSCSVPPFLDSIGDGYLCPIDNIILRNSTPDPLCDSNSSQIIGCLSDCSLYDSDQACCRGQFSDPKICPPSSQWFKAACPHAYSYAYDENASFTCSQPVQAIIDITFNC
ncbi:PR5-like protein [Xylogone sp. PMI_703]|nr:PR5-like protein [Xylogone sp. PMI_703]